MNTIDFFKTVVAGEGFFCAATIVDKIVKHRVFDTQEDLADHVTTVSASRDMYFAVGTLAERSIVDAAGKKRIRTAANIHQMKSMILDLDVGDAAHKYHTQQAALTDLARFCRETKLPYPTVVVNSGYGVHAYWALLKAIDAGEWATHAEKLKALLARYGVKQDPSRTADRCSILRPPGTLNHKKPDSPQPVTVMHDGDTLSNDAFFTLLDAACSEASVVPSQPSTKSKAFDTGLGATSVTELVSAKRIAERCAQFKHFIENQADIPEPLWYKGALSLANHCKNSRKVAHFISRNHPHYTPEETERKMDQLAGVGPALCETIDTLNPGMCDKCPYKGKILSPKSLGKELNEAAYGTEKADQNGETRVIPEPVGGFKFGAEGGLYYTMSSTDKRTGEILQSEIQVHPDIFFPTRIIRSEDNSMSVHVAVLNSRDGWYDFTTPMQELSSKQSTMKTLSRFGLNNTTEQEGFVHNYMATAIQDLRSRVKSQLAFSQMGWMEDDNTFVVGTDAFTADGNTVESAVTAEVERFAKTTFEKAGDVKAWAEALDTMYNRKGCEAYQLVFAMGAFGSPILKFSGYQGALVNFVGQPGTGKSTLLQAIMSVFGAPKENVLQVSDTVKSKENIMGMFQNLPIVHDEITNIEGGRLSEFAYAASSGRSNHRLTAESKLRTNSSTWQLLVACTSNSSLLQKLSTEKSDSSAEAVRIFEIYSPAAENLPITKAEANDFIRELAKHHGVAGREYARYLVTHKDEVRQRIYDMIAHIDGLLGNISGERFWVAALACGVVGNQIAVELGLSPFSSETILEAGIKQIHEMRGKMASYVQTPIDVISAFINDHLNETLILEKAVHQRTKLMPLHSPKGALVARHILETGRMYISSHALVTYCSQTCADFHRLKETLLASGVLVTNRKFVTLGANTEFGGGQTLCWEINMDHPDMKQDGLPLELVQKAA